MKEPANCLGCLIRLSRVGSKEWVNSECLWSSSHYRVSQWVACEVREGVSSVRGGREQERVIECLNGSSRRWWGHLVWSCISLTQNSCGTVGESSREGCLFRDSWQSNSLPSPPPDSRMQGRSRGEYGV